MVDLVCKYRIFIYAKPGVWMQDVKYIETGRPEYRRQDLLFAACTREAESGTVNSGHPQVIRASVMCRAGTATYAHMHRTVRS